MSAPEPWVLIERDAAAAAGADTMGCGDFLDLCERAERSLAPSSRRATAPVPRRTPGDLFPG